MDNDDKYKVLRDDWIRDEIVILNKETGEIRTWTRVKVLVDKGGGFFTPPVFKNGWMPVDSIGERRREYLNREKE